MSRYQSLLLIPWVAFACWPSVVYSGSLETPTLEPPRIIGQDTRKTYEQYAALHKMSVQAVYDKFLATGRLYCGNNLSTANVTLERNIIVGAAHSFYADDCKPKFKTISDCTFYAITGPGLLSEPYELAGIPAVGTKCPEPRGNSHVDWFVARLKKNVANVRPYRLHPNCQMRIGLTATYIAAASDNFGDKENPPPNVGVCKIIDGYSGYFDSNCSAGHGGSGGAFACDTREGLFISGNAVAVGISGDGSASYTTMVPLANNFLETLLDMAKSQKK